MRALWLVIYFGVLIWSAIEPKSYFIWSFEVAPALIGVVLIVVTYQKFPLTPLLYRLILIHSIILMMGGHYTQAEVPIFDNLKTVFGFERNAFAYVGNFFQGLVPALLAREILIRFEVVRTPAWRHFIIICICLAVSAFYDLIGWWIAALFGDAVIQGDIWETQSNMTLVLLGSICMLLLLRRVHDRQLERVDRNH